MPYTYRINLFVYCVPDMLHKKMGCASDGFNSIHETGILTIRGRTISVPYHTSNGLPLITSIAGVASYTSYLTYAASEPTSSHTNLSPSQWAKLILHEHYNHTNMKTINDWIRKGILKVDKAIANCTDPICRACQFCKARTRPHKSDTGIIAQNHTSPGQGASADQLEAGYPGQTPTMRGLPSPKHYKYVNIWVDHFPNFIYPTFHETKEL